MFLFFEIPVNVYASKNHHKKIFLFYFGDSINKNNCEMLKIADEIELGREIKVKTSKIKLRVEKRGCQHITYTTVKCKDLVYHSEEPKRIFKKFEEHPSRYHIIHDEIVSLSRDDDISF